MIFARKVNKIPEFYVTFALKMPEMYIIIARKIFFRNFRWGAWGPTSYAYEQKEIKLCAGDSE